MVGRNRAGADTKREERGNGMARGKVELIRGALFVLTCALMKRNRFLSHFASGR
jgi:hypothetical protein